MDALPFFWKDSWLDCGTFGTVFPHLYRLTSNPDATVAEVWMAATSAWDLCLHPNLNDLETIKWFKPSHILSSVHWFAYRFLLTLGLGLLILLRGILLNLLWRSDGYCWSTFKGYLHSDLEGNLSKENQKVPLAKLKLQINK